MYQIENPIGKAMQGMSNASGSYGAMMNDIPANRDPGPTAGGAISAGMGGATTAAAAGSLMSSAGAGAAGGAVGGAWGMAIGAAIGIGAYLLS